MKAPRSWTVAFAAATLLALSGAAFAGPLATTGGDVVLGGFEYSGGVAESGETALTFVGTEYGALATTSGPLALPGFVVASRCLEDDDGLTNLREEAAGTNPCLYDTDGDGLADGRDVEFVQSALVADVFRDRGARGIRNAMLSILNDIEVLLLAGNVRDATQKIEDLRRRADGCASAAGTADTNDWIVQCAAQLAIRADLELLAANARR